MRKKDVSESSFSKIYEFYPGRYPSVLLGKSGWSKERPRSFNRTSDALSITPENGMKLLKAIQAFGYSRVSVPAQVLENSGRELNETYKEKLVNKVIFHYGRKLLLPYPLSAIYTTAMSVKYIWLGVKTLMEA